MHPLHCLPLRGKEGVTLSSGKMSEERENRISHENHSYQEV